MGPSALNIFFYKSDHISEKFMRPDFLRSGCSYRTRLLSHPKFFHGPCYFQGGENGGSTFLPLCDRQSGLIDISWIWPPFLTTLLSVIIELPSAPVS